MPPSSSIRPISTEAAMPHRKIDLVEVGITEDELTRATEPFYVRLEEGLRSNDYWLFTVLDGSQDQPYTLNWSRHRKAFYDSLTVQNINDIASALLQDNLAIAVEIIPMAVVQDDPVGGADSGEPTGTDNSNRSLRSGTPRTVSILDF
jgi:hypothetical protein